MVNLVYIQTAIQNAFNSLEMIHKKQLRYHSVCSIQEVHADLYAVQLSS